MHYPKRVILLDLRREVYCSLTDEQKTYHYRLEELFAQSNLNLFAISR